MINLLSSVSLTLCVMIVKVSAVDVEKRNPYCLSLRMFLFEAINNFVVDNGVKKYEDDTKAADETTLKRTSAHPHS